MPDPEGPTERLNRVLAAARLRPTLPPVPVPSDSNDAWIIHDQHHGDLVLRVGWQGDTSRLLREAEVARTLPPAVGYPDVINFGRGDGAGALTWALTPAAAGPIVGRSVARPGRQISGSRLCTGRHDDHCIAPLEAASPPAPRAPSHTAGCTSDGEHRRGPYDTSLA
ncbi:MAG: hypothetical protein AVDCRST_MAG75-1461 [uncultured Propionibacteriaceae bacterium]|uniref:Aminoglycoside phosphotransferase domain-containing protein n=1 Tax=uncultured Propionibacteriaceae bacterium TaxID=257457 RepID=A0A6J4NJU9_9ACTN|nr:MAG: hypothetical protein AVDCRST_MAG75-1461 [uncultured Propionibacteriaceae bacterium]